MQSCDGAADMTFLTALRSLLAKVKTRTLRDESEDKFGRVEEEAASLEKKAITHLWFSFNLGRRCRHSAHSCLIGDAPHSDNVSFHWFLA